MGGDYMFSEYHQGAWHDGIQPKLCCPCGKTKYKYELIMGNHMYCNRTAYKKIVPKICGCEFEESEKEIRQKIEKDFFCEHPQEKMKNIISSVNYLSVKINSDINDFYSKCVEIIDILKHVTGKKD